MDAQELIKRHNDGERNFNHAGLRDANLRGADLCGASLRDADLFDADLCGASLRGANLCVAYLRGASLRGANLCGANLRGANLFDADLCGANLRGTCLDQTRTPNMVASGFEAIEDDWLIGYRTKLSPYGIDNGPYLVGQERWAHEFSVSDTECHPGIFVCPTLREAREWTDEHNPNIVAVIFRPWELHKAGRKHRVRWCIVWDDINPL